MSDENRMDISIVIVNWNTKDMLRDCLNSIKKEKGMLTVQTLVIDNDSADGSREMVGYDFPEVKLINSGGNVGFAKANNIATGYAESQLVLFLNPDTIVLPGSLQKMVNYMDVNPTVGALGCMMIGADGEPQPLGLQWNPTPVTKLIEMLFISTETLDKIKSILPYKDPYQSGQVKILFGGCLMVRKAILDQVGWFDERYFMYVEDADLCRKIAERGWRLYYLSEAQIVHLGGGATKNRSSKYETLMTLESLSKSMMKHYGKSGYWMYRLVVFVGSNARLIVLSIIRIMSIGHSIDRSNNTAMSFNKYSTMLKWSLGVEKPNIPAGFINGHQASSR